MQVSNNPPLISSHIIINQGGNQYEQIILDPVSTSDTTPTTIYTLNLAVNQGVRILVTGTAIQSDGSNVWDIDNRNSYRRTSGGTSARVGGASGTAGESSGNTFANPRPSLSWFDPTAGGTLNQAGVNLVGKASTNITWYLKIEIMYNS